MRRMAENSVSLCLRAETNSRRVASAGGAMRHRILLRIIRAAAALVIIRGGHLPSRATRQSDASPVNPVRLPPCPRRTRTRARS